MTPAQGTSSVNSTKSWVGQGMGPGNPNLYTKIPRSHVQECFI